MVRTVAFSQHSTEPKWLEVGKEHLLKGAYQPKPEGAHGKWEDAAGARTAQRFGRLAGFLGRHYPEYFSGIQPLRAGSAAVQELMKIHQLQPDAANRLAPRCLSGDIKVAQLHQELFRLLDAGKPVHAGRQASSRWIAEFRALAIGRIETEPILPDAMLISEVLLITQRSALIPDLAVRYKDSNRLIAVDIKAPRETSARSVTNVAAGLISRVATLRLHYDDAVLVLPVEAAHIATATISLWREWVKVHEPRWCRINILLLGQSSHQLLSGEPENSNSGSRAKR